MIVIYIKCTGEFTKRVREMSSQLLVTLYSLSIYPSAHKQLRRHLPNPFCEFHWSTHEGSHFKSTMPSTFVYRTADLSLRSREDLIRDKSGVRYPLWMAGYICISYTWNKNGIYQNLLIMQFLLVPKNIDLNLFLLHKNIWRAYLWMFIKKLEKKLPTFNTWNFPNYQQIKLLLYIYI